jgi:ribonuclease BN (tRNA processing enzyme)
MTSELVLLGTAAAPMPVPGRGGIASALIVDEHIFVVDCGRGSPSAFVNAGLDFRKLHAVFVTHLHVDHVGDLPGLLLYPWGVRWDGSGALPPIRIYGPPGPPTLPPGEGTFDRVTTIDPQRPVPGTSEMVQSILAGFACHLNVMPLDALMPDAGSLVRAIDIALPTRTRSGHQRPVTVFDEGGTRVTAIVVTHGHAFPALAYRFDTPDGSVVFSGDTTANDDLIQLADAADVLVHCVADLSYLERHGTTGAELQHMAGLHTDVTEVGHIAERACVGELILSHYLPAEPDAISEGEWAARTGTTFRGTTTAGRDGLRRVIGRSAG